ncbi:MAG: tetratricopeptide repeat protein [Candidatus Zixiibacteriota bacterium]
MKYVRVILLAGLFAFVVGAVMAQKSEKPRFPASTYKTTAKIQMKDEYRMYDSAAVILEEGVRFYPEDPEMHFLLGKAYIPKNNYRGMGEQFALAESLKSDAKWIDELKEIKKDKWAQVFNQGAKAFNEKDFDTALDRFVTCTVIDRTNYRGFLYAGLAYTLKKQYDQAISYLEAGIKVSPDNAEMLKGYADALLFAGKQKEALQVYGKVLDKDPKNAEALINIVSVYSADKDYDQALVYSKKLVEVDPTYKDGHFNMGTIYLQKIVQTGAALDSLKDSSGVYLKDEKSAARVKELTAKRNEYLSSAQAAFEKVLAIDSADVEAQIYLSQVSQEQGNLDQALKILEPLCAKDSTNCDILSQLAVIYAKKGVGDKAKQCWQKAQDCLNKPK